MSPYSHHHHTHLSTFRKINRYFPQLCPALLHLFLSLVMLALQPAHMWTLLRRSSSTVKHLLNNYEVVWLLQTSEVRKSSKSSPHPNTDPSQFRSFIDRCALLFEKNLSITQHKCHCRQKGKWAIIASQQCMAGYTPFWPAGFHWLSNVICDISIHQIETLIHINHL